MPKRHWVSYGPIGIGLVICALLAAAVSVQQPQQGECGYRTADQHATDALHRLQCGGVPEITGVETPARKPNPKRKLWRQESDLEAQWETARWTRYATFVGGLACALTIVGIWFVRQTLQANRAAVDAAYAAIARSDKHAEREMRAYLTFKDGEVIEHEGNLLVAELKFINTGQTPAYHVRGQGTYAITSMSDPPAFDMTERMHGVADMNVVGNGQWMTLTIPCDDASFDVIAEMKEIELTQFLWGNITYVDAFEQNRFFRFRCMTAHRIHERGDPLGRWRVIVHPQTGCDAD